MDTHTIVFDWVETVYHTGSTFFEQKYKEYAVYGYFIVNRETMYRKEVVTVRVPRGFDATLEPDVEDVNETEVVIFQWNPDDGLYVVAEVHHVEDTVTKRDYKSYGCREFFKMRIIRNNKGYRVSFAKFVSPKGERSGL